jgi:hypothetical protein
MSRSVVFSCPGDQSSRSSALIGTPRGRQQYGTSELTIWRAGFRAIAVTNSRSPEAASHHKPTANGASAMRAQPGTGKPQAQQGDAGGGCAAPPSVAHRRTGQARKGERER